MGLDMKNVQISQELFIKLIQFHLLDIYDSGNEIKKGLEEKIDMMARHEAYTKSKTALSEIRMHTDHIKILCSCLFPLRFG